MDINEIKVGERYWWNGTINNDNKLSVPQEVIVERVDVNTVLLPVKIKRANGYMNFVYAETLSPLPEHEDAK